MTRRRVGTRRDATRRCSLAKAAPGVLGEVIGGVSDEVERLTGEAGLLIMKAMMDAEVESLAGPKGNVA